MKSAKCGDRSISVCIGEKRLVTALCAAAGMLLTMCNGDSAFDRRLEYGLLSIAEELELHAKMVIELVRSKQEDSSISSIVTAADDLSRAIDKYKSVLKLERAER